MHVDTTTRRYKGKVYKAHLVRRSYREGGKVKKETIANLTGLPDEIIEMVRRALQGQRYVPAGEAFEILRSLPHGHVAAAVGMARKLGVDKLLGARRSRQRDLAMAMVVGPVVKPSSKLALSRWWADTTLCEALGLEDADEDDLYGAMDWALVRQERVEAALAERHLSEGGMVLYDLTSSYFEGRKCELAAYGNNRDGKRGKLQVNWGLVTDAEGCPVAIEVFEGNTSDPKTVQQQVDKVRERFGIERLVLVGDRGMITKARIEHLREHAEGVDWITALKAPQIQKLREGGSLQLSLFDERDLAEITDPAYPGERLVVCRNPLLADERARKRAELLAATEKLLGKVQQTVERQRARGKPESADKIGVRVGKVIDRYKVGKHFELEIGDGRLRWQLRQDRIDREAALDGIYVIRTSVDEGRLAAEDVVRTYKRLAKIERAFRSMKTVHLEVRPIRHHREDRVRAHFFLCMLAYYVLWHLKRAWRPLLFADELDTPRSDASSPVVPARRSEAAERKARTKRTVDGLPAHSYATLIEHLASLTRNISRLKDRPDTPTFAMLSRMTSAQREAFELIGVSPPNV